MRGAYNTGGTAAGAADLANASISFVFALAQPPTVRIVQDNAVPPAECPGTVALPQAAPGNLCIFAEETFNVSPAGLQLNDVPNGVTRAGATVFVESAAADNFYSFGTWAVTAP